MVLRNTTRNETIKVIAYPAYNLDNMLIGWYSWQEDRAGLWTDRATFYPRHAWEEVR